MDPNEEPNQNTINPFKNTTSINRTPTSTTIVSFHQPINFDEAILTSTPNRASVYRELLLNREQSLSNVENIHTTSINTQIRKEEEISETDSFLDSEAEEDSEHESLDDDAIEDAESPLSSEENPTPNEKRVAIISTENTSKFEIATFNRIIPEYKGDLESLNIFLRRCETYNSSLTPKGKKLFLDNLIYKLTGRAFIIYEAKPLTDWKSLKADLSNGIGDKKSIATLQNELLALKQTSQENATDFAEIIRNKLKKLTDKITELYDDNDVVRQSFYSEHEKMAVRAFKEGLAPPLKYRVLNSNDTSFERIRQFALEEEPFTKRSSIPNLISPLNQKETQIHSINPNKNGNSYDRTRDNNFNRNTQQFNNFANTNGPGHFNNRPDPFQNYYQHSNRYTGGYSQQPRQYRNNYNQQLQSNSNNFSQYPRQYPNNFNQPNRQYNNQNNTYNTRYNPNNGQTNRDRNIMICSRCGKRGHIQDTCYVKLDKIDPNNTSHNDIANAPPFNQNQKINFQPNKPENPFNRKISMTKVIPKNKLMDEEFGLPVQTTKRSQ